MSISLMLEDSRTEGPIEQKVTAERTEDFVVFHIGMRINAFWKVHRWIPLLLIAPRMVRELVADRESGLLESRTVVGPGIRHIGFVQYWESFDALREYARDGNRLHLSAWQDYYQSGDNEDAVVGIWHETYLVGANDYESVYNNMPIHGLGACDRTEVVPAVDQLSTAAGRLGRPDDADSPSVT